MPVLQQQFYMLGSRVVAQNVFYVDWGMPYSAKNLRTVDYEMLHGMSAEGCILWECPDSYTIQRRFDILEFARYRGFEIKPTTEFLSWLKKHMQPLVQAQATGGFNVLVQSLLKPQ